MSILRLAMSVVMLISFCVVTGASLSVCEPGEDAFLARGGAPSPTCPRSSGDGEGVRMGKRGGEKGNRIRIRAGNGVKHKEPEH